MLALSVFLRVEFFRVQYRIFANLPEFENNLNYKMGDFNDVNRRRGAVLSELLNSYRFKKQIETAI